MNEIELTNRISGGIYTRLNILQAMQKIDEGFKKTQLRYLLEKLQKAGRIVQVGHNQYRNKTETQEKSEYQNLYSDIAKKIILHMEANYPLLDYRVWEFTWLNEFLNHQIAYNKIFLEVENEGCGFIYTDLSNKFQGQLLYRPTIEELFRYSTDDGIIIERLISESPKGHPKRYNVSLEKLIVDLFANKKLQSMVSKGDYSLAIEDMFAKYQIDQVKMFRYAGRRNKAGVLYDFLKSKTNVEVVVEV